MFLRTAPIKCFEHSSTLKHSFRFQRLDPVNEKEATIVQIFRVYGNNRFRYSIFLEDGHAWLIKEESGSNIFKMRKIIYF